MRTKECLDICVEEIADMFPKKGSNYWARVKCRYSPEVAAKAEIAAILEKGQIPRRKYSKLQDPKYRTRCIAGGGSPGLEIFAFICGILSFLLAMYAIVTAPTIRDAVILPETWELSSDVYAMYLLSKRGAYLDQARLLILVGAVYAVVALGMTVQSDVLSSRVCEFAEEFDKLEKGEKAFQNTLLGDYRLKRAGDYRRLLKESLREVLAEVESEKIKPKTTRRVIAEFGVVEPEMVRQETAEVGALESASKEVESNV